MKLRLYKDFTFSASHTVDTLPEGHQCRRCHGHTYGVRVWIEGPYDTATGFCGGTELEQIKSAWKEIDARLDHNHLNDVIGGPCTVEGVAIYIFSQLSLRLPMLIRVDVTEGPTAGATIEL
jgi:6-pyruvoyltetrahydropterin/6-carboxytetrahydropterin synthase